MKSCDGAVNPCNTFKKSKYKPLSPLKLSSFSGTVEEEKLLHLDYLSTVINWLDLHLNKTNKQINKETNNKSKLGCIVG